MGARMTQNFLVTGASGLLGKKIKARLGREGTAWGWCFRRSDKGCVSVDITSSLAVENFFAKNPLDLCVHCAGDPNIKSCEADQKRAWELNVGGTANVVQACIKHKVKLIYISSDFVFDGSQEDGYREEDRPAPLQFYGRTKLEGERLASTAPQSLIVRIPLLYGYNDADDRPTWPSQTISALKAGQRLPADNIEIRQPTLIDDIAGSLVRLFQKNCSGVIHIAAQEGITKWQWSRNIAGALNLNAELVTPSAPEAAPKRPRRAWLKIDKLRALGLEAPVGVSIGTQRYLEMLGARLPYDASPGKL